MWRTLLQYSDYCRMLIKDTCRGSFINESFCCYQLLISNKYKCYIDTASLLKFVLILYEYYNVYNIHI